MNPAARQPCKVNKYEAEVLAEIKREEFNPVTPFWKLASFVSRSKGRRVKKPRIREINLVTFRDTGRTWSLHRFPVDVFASECCPHAEEPVTAFMDALCAI